MMNDPNCTGNAGWFRDIRRLLDITEVTPGLPLPRIAPGRAYYSFTDRPDAAEAIRLAESILSYALDVTFAPRWTQAGSTRHYIRGAVLPSGLLLDLVAHAEAFDGDGDGEDARQLEAVAA